MWGANRTAILFHHEAQDRALLACVGASIALHALVLFGLPGFQASAHPESLDVLTASFAPRPAPPQSSPSLERVAPKPPREREPEKPRPLLAKPEPDVAIAAQAAEPAPSPLPHPPEVAPAASVVEASRTLEAPSAETTAKPSVETFDAGLLDAYRLALIDAAKRYKRYPVQAMERGWQGRVEIRLIIGADGRIKNVLIKRSSNYPILDDQALDMVKKGKPMAQIPPALRGREFTVDVPVIFELQTG
ncbi:MAG TPA: energy transducer TonB [Burkholderiales bacterium]